MEDMIQELKASNAMIVFYYRDDTKQMFLENRDMTLKSNADYSRLGFDRKKCMARIHTVMSNRLVQKTNFPDPQEENISREDILNVCCNLGPFAGDLDIETVVDTEIFVDSTNRGCGSEMIDTMIGVVANSIWTSLCQNRGKNIHMYVIMADPYNPGEIDSMHAYKDHMMNMFKKNLGIKSVETL